MPSRQLTFHQEIRDAILERERLLLVIGPFAVKSDYVHREWDFAFNQAGKAVTPILREGDYSLLPAELAQLHCEDFRDDTQYQFHLENLVRQLSDFPPQQGKLFGVPSLPRYYVSRPEKIAFIREKIVLWDVPSCVGIHGMGGLGKSVLANAVIRDRQVRETFPDGIVWVRVGPSPNRVGIQRRIHRQLGGDGLIGSEIEGRTKLREVYANKRILLILDDVWQRADVESFDVLEPVSHALITTRDEGLLSTLGIEHHSVDLMTDEEARQLMAKHVDVGLSNLPLEADAVVQRCGRLPLAIALCGGLIRTGEYWSDVLGALQEHDLKFIDDEHPLEEKHRDLWKAIDVSFRHLSKEQQRRFAELSVFPSSVPEASIVTLWSYSGNLGDRQARKLLRQFNQRSLVKIEQLDSGDIYISLHDLLHDFSAMLAERLLLNSSMLHDLVTKAYKKRCSTDWWTGPNDGYFFTHLREHLLLSGGAEELVGLAPQLEWLETKNIYGYTYDLLDDLSAAIDTLSVNDHRRVVMKLIRDAINRDIHFIAEHRADYSQAMFQSLWNMCWWYGTQAEAKQSSEAETDSEKGACISAASLLSLAESWRKQKEQEAGFSWLRSLRPPAWSLGSPLISKLSAVGSKLIFSPDDRIFALSDYPEIKIFNTQTRGCLISIVTAPYLVEDFQFSIDGEFLFALCIDSKYKSWDERTWHLKIWRVLDGAMVESRDLPAACTAFSRAKEQDLIGISLDNGKIEILDIRSGQRLSSIDVGMQLDGFALSARSEIIALIYKDGVLAIKGTAVGESAVKLGNAPQEYGNKGISFIGDSSIFAVVGGDLSLWDAGQRCLVLEAKLKNHGNVQFSRDGSRFVCASPGAFVKIWETNSGALVNKFEELFDIVWDAALSSDGALLLYSTQGSTKLMDISMPNSDTELVGRHIPPAVLRFSPSGDSIVSGAENGSVYVFDVANSEMWGLGGHDGDITGVSFSRDGHWLATECGTVTIVSNPVPFVVLWSRQSEIEAETLRVFSSYYCPTFSGDSQFLVLISTENGSLCIYDLENERENLLLAETFGYTSCIGMAEEASVLVQVLKDGLVVRWDISSNSRTECFRHDGRITAVACSRTGNLIAAASEKDISLWRADHVSFLTFPHGHSTPIGKIFISGSVLVACSQSRITSWNLEDRGIVCQVETDKGISIKKNQVGREIIWRHPAVLKGIEFSESGVFLAGFDDESHLTVFFLEPV